MNIIPSIIHWFLAYYLAIEHDMKLVGVAISTSVHFVCRFLVIFACVNYDKDLR